MRSSGFFALATAFLFVACGSSGSSTTTTGIPGHTGPSSSNPPPPPDVGVQIAPPVRVVNPGEQFFECYYTSLASDTDIGTHHLMSAMTPGSHHLVVYTTNTAMQPDGTFADCPDEQIGTPADPPVWLFATQAHDAEFIAPSGVAIPLKAHQPLVLNMHYLNATDSAMNVQVWLNIDYQPPPFQAAGSYVTFNTQIAIPPNTTIPLSVSGNCDVPSGAQFFAMSTHSHSHTVDAQATKWLNGEVGDPLVNTIDWAHAAMTRWAVPPYMTFAPGEQLHYQCSYVNQTADPVSVGSSSLTEEMCMVVGYYFPAASGGTFCTDSTVR